jgi:hypothetical protein
VIAEEGIEEQPGVADEVKKTQWVSEWMKKTIQQWNICDIGRL